MPGEDPSDLSPLWQYVEIERHILPAAPVELPSRHGIAGRWRHFGARRKPAREGAGAVEGERSSLSRALLQRLIPTPDWQAAAAALDAALAPHLAHGPSPVVPAIVLGLPHSGTAGILELWAKMRGWQVIQPPSYQQILAQDQRWLAQFGTRHLPWVLPRLERCYLRHHRGLALVQGLLELLGSGGAGRCLVGCDSWALAYLARVPPGMEWKGPRLVAQSCDADRLARWLQPGDDGHGPPIVVREADTNLYVLPVTPAAETTADEATRPGSFLKYLAAYSMGIPAIACAVWQDALGKAILSSPAANARMGPVGPQEVLVPSWKQLDLPTLPEDAREQAFVLHALLLHNGLPTPALSQVLPLSASEVVRSLHRLCNAALIETVDDHWQVRAIAYPAVSRLLGDVGYLTDTHAIFG